MMGPSAIPRAWRGSVAQAYVEAAEEIARSGHVFMTPFATFARSAEVDVVVCQVWGLHHA
eukprot:1969993-Prorocentrum_lima.AAC.1